MSPKNSLKLITLNIEGSHHLDKAIPWLKKEQPHVLCLQELFAVDVPLFEEELGLKGHFAPMTKVEHRNKHNIPDRGLWGLGIFSALETDSVQSFWYKGERTEVPEFEEPNSVNRILLSAAVKKGRDVFNIATTHFTWSPAGQATDEQRRDLSRLLEFIREYDELILCGDFNAPRGREIYTQLSELLQDLLPAEITTTIDPDLHYAGALELVVDSIFTTQGFQATNVRAQSGVSDHQAIVANISKK